VPTQLTLLFPSTSVVWTVSPLASVFSGVGTCAVASRPHKRPVAVTTTVFLSVVSLNQSVRTSPDLSILLGIAGNNVCSPVSETALGPNVTESMRT
jgi:hypothetical protein